MSCDRITAAWAEGLKERFDDAKAIAHDEPGKYDAEIDLACFFARKSQAYKDFAAEVARDSTEYLADHTADNMTRTFLEAVENLKALSDGYEGLSNKVWASFEKDAIRANDDEAPFINLLGAIYSEIVEDYKRAVWDICQPWGRGRSIAGDWKLHMNGLKNYVECRDYFRDSTVERVVESEIDPLQRDYIKILAKAFYGREY